MEIKYINTIGLFAYIIVANEEIHSNQIKLLHIVLNQLNLDDSFDIVKDILDDNDEKISYNDCLSAFMKESIETKELIYRVCFQLAFIDGDNTSDNIDKNIDTQEKQILKTLESNIKNFNAKYQKKKALEEIDKTLFSYSNNENDFGIDINLVLKTSIADYNDYEHVINSIMSESNILKTRLESRLKYSNSNTVKKAIKSFLDIYMQNVFAVFSDIKENSLKKELAVHCFSIALMGRTKAGKSTLHYIMCNEGKEFIGKGMQRTTRFKRIFNWNKLKIIDTPGIGAGEEQGRKDEEIALSVLPQADMICFVIVDDTIQNDVLDLLNKIAEYHKPMIIVLNHKEDIRKKSHFNTFKNDPNNWRFTKKESNLEGYINRLNRNAVKHNYDKLMKIVPVFLLAAQIGKENNDSTFFEASNYPEFIKTIGSLVGDNHLIYKSQTMLDEPSIRLHKAYDVLETEEGKLRTLKNKVNNIKSRINHNIISSKNTILSESEKNIITEFDNFYTAKSELYIEENYKEKSVIALNNSYNKYLEEYGVKKHIESILSEYLSEYHIKITKIVQEIDEELNYAKLNTDCLFGDNTAQIEGNRSTASFKDVFKASSMIFDVLSIAYPVLAVISISISITSLFIKSKEDKIKRNQKLTSDNFKKLTDYQQEKAVKENKKMLEKIFDADEEEISVFFNNLEEQLKEIIDYVSGCSSEIKNGIKQIDMCLANRIMQYIMVGTKELTVVDAKRDLKNNMFIIYIKRPKIKVEFDINKYKKISTETIKVLYKD